MLVGIVADGVFKVVFAAALAFAGQPTRTAHPAR